MWQEPITRAVQIYPFCNTLDKMIEYQAKRSSRPHIHTGVLRSAESVLQPCQNRQILKYHIKPLALRD